MTGPIPTLYWCRSTLRSGRVRLNPQYWRITNAYLVGPDTLGRAKPGSKLDIAVVVESVTEAEPSMAAAQLNRDYYARFEIPEHLPRFQGRLVNFKFFYPDDSTLANSRRVELPLK